MPTIYLIDASPYIFRAYYSLPTTIKSPGGRVVNAVYGYTQFLIQILKKEEPTHMAVAFDGSLTTSFRNEIYPAYKAGREPPPPELEAQLEACFKVTEAMGLAAFIDDNYEADDIVATLASTLDKKDHCVVVVSNDKDLVQLVNDQITYWDFAKNQRYGLNIVKEKFGVYPEQIVDLLALMGDSVDNIPGVKGIGRKTAVRLLNEFRNLEDIYENIHSLGNLAIRGASAIKNNLIAGRGMAKLSKRLASLALDVPVVSDIRLLANRGAKKNLIEPLFGQLGFERILDRIPKWNPRKAAGYSRFG